MKQRGANLINISYRYIKKLVTLTRWDWRQKKR